MKLIYIAGPYSAPAAAARLRNVQEAREVADLINRVYGDLACAVVPHFLSAGIEDSLSPERWYAATLEVLRRCDAVVLTARWAESTGAREERAEAYRRGMPVFQEADLQPAAPQGPSRFLRWLEGGATP